MDLPHEIEFGQRMENRDRYIQQSRETLVNQRAEPPPRGSAVGFSPTPASWYWPHKARMQRIAALWSSLWSRGML